MCGYRTGLSDAIKPPRNLPLHTHALGTPPSGLQRDDRVPDIKSGSPVSGPWTGCSCQEFESVHLAHSYRSQPPHQYPGPPWSPISRTICRAFCTAMMGYICDRRGYKTSGPRFLVMQEQAIKQSSMQVSTPVQVALPTLTMCCDLHHGHGTQTEISLTLNARLVAIKHVYRSHTGRKIDFTSPRSLRAGCVVKTSASGQCHNKNQ